VGGDYIGRNGAEIEGNMVVLGDLMLKEGGPSNFGSVGVGSQVVPSNNGDCIIVGGDLKPWRNTQVYNQRRSMKCDVVYRGEGREVDRFKTFGEVRSDEDLDLTFYENMKKVWERKSKYWATIPPTGKVQMAGSTTEFQCNSDTDIEVFNVYADNNQCVQDPMQGWQQTNLVAMPRGSLRGKMQLQYSKLIVVTLVFHISNFNISYYQTGFLSLYVDDKVS